MKRLLLALLLTASAQAQPILRNSLNTNTLGTNLVWTPGLRFLEIFGDAGNPGSFAVNSNDISTAVIAGDNASQLPSLAVNGFLRLTSGPYFYPIAAGTGITLTTNSLGNNQTNVTISASGGGSTTDTNIVTLTMTGTNVSSMDFALVQNGGAFKLVLTGNAYVGSPANVVNTSFKKAWLLVQQPSTGTCLLQFTNGVAGFAWPQGVAPVMDTNNSSVAVFEFVTDVFTNGLVHGTMSSLSKTATNL